jgi:hypothetical protein
MERLTLDEAINHEKMMAKRKRWNGKFTKVSLGNEEINKRFKADCIKDAEEHEQFAEWLEELKSYKDLEEQGLLVRLPCKVGDTVYKFWYYDRSPYKIQQHVTRTLSEICELIESKKLGKSVFLTREEAEKKLEEMGNDKT